jgi:hypothetical protein
MSNREIDVSVAEKVMGWTVNRADGRHWHTIAAHVGAENPGLLVGLDCCEERYSGAFMPSRRIEDAWKVVEKMSRKGYTVDVRACFDGYAVNMVPHDLSGDGMTRIVQVGDDTAPMAICIAALKAHGITPEKQSGDSA